MSIQINPKMVQTNKISRLASSSLVLLKSQIKSQVNTSFKPIEICLCPCQNKSSSRTCRSLKSGPKLVQTSPNEIQSQVPSQMRWVKVKYQSKKVLIQVPHPGLVRLESQVCTNMSRKAKNMLTISNHQCLLAKCQYKHPIKKCFSPFNPHT